MEQEVRQGPENGPNGQLETAILNVGRTCHFKSKLCSRISLLITGGETQNTLNL